MIQIHYTGKGFCISDVKQGKMTAKLNLPDDELGEIRSYNSPLFAPDEKTLFTSTRYSNDTHHEGQLIEEWWRWENFNTKAARLRKETRYDFDTESVLAINKDSPNLILAPRLRDKWGLEGATQKQLKAVDLLTGKSHSY